MTHKQAFRTYGVTGKYAEMLIKDTAFGRAVLALGPIRCFYMRDRWHLDQRSCTTYDILDAVRCRHAA